MGNGVLGDLFHPYTHPSLWPFQVSVSLCLTFQFSAHFLFYYCFFPLFSQSTSSSFFPLTTHQPSLVLFSTTIHFLFSPLPTLFCLCFHWSLHFYLYFLCQQIMLSLALYLAVSATVSLFAFLLFLSFSLPGRGSPLFPSQKPPTLLAPPPKATSVGSLHLIPTSCAPGDPPVWTPPILPFVCPPNPEIRNPLQQALRWLRSQASQRK